MRVELDDVTKRYGSLRALDGVSLDLGHHRSSRTQWCRQDDPHPHPRNSHVPVTRTRASGWPRSG
jgi:hypothetical protein